MATLKKRGNVYHGRHIYHENGVRREKHKTFRTMDQRDAYRRLAEWEKELQADTFGEAYSLRFEEAALRWQNEQVSGLRPNTAIRYETSLRKLRPFFEGRRMNSITPQDLSRFEARRRKDPGRTLAKSGERRIMAVKDNGCGKGRQSRERKAWAPVSDVSIRRDFACLSALMTFAVQRGWAALNPVPAYLKERKHGLKRGQARDRYLSHAEEARLMAAAAQCQKSDFDRRVFMGALTFAIGTGLRKHEQLMLQWRDVQRGSRPRIAVRDGKGGKARTVPLLPNVANGVANLPIGRGGKLVFCHEDGRAIGSFDTAFDEAVKRAGLEDLTWHDLRRTCGCRLLQDHGLSMVQVRDWLGHSSIAVTEKHYAFLSVDDLFEAIEKSADRIAAQPSAQVLPLRKVRQ